MNVQGDKIVRERRGWGEKEREKENKRKKEGTDKEGREERERERETERRKGTFQDAITTFLGRASNQQLFL